MFLDSTPVFARGARACNMRGPLTGRSRLLLVAVKRRFHALKAGARGAGVHEQQLSKGGDLNSAVNW